MTDETTTDETTKAINLERYRVVDADKDGETPPERRPWKRQAIFLSPICVAVHLSIFDPDCRDETEVEAAKSALFRYLRQVHQAVMDHGIIVPLAAVIEAPHQGSKARLANALETWGSDQTWHRGGFTLYPKKPGDDTKERLRDLLSPRAEAMKNLETDVHDQAWFAARLRETQIKFQDQSQREAADLAGKCAARIAPGSSDKSTSDPFVSLTEWKSKRLGDARDMARGGGPA